MKLFVVAALIAISSAARLEHLERGYLPPNGPGQGQVVNDFGANSQQGFGAQQGFGSQQGFGGQQGLGGASVAAARNGGSFGAATSNQYLPPNHGPAGHGSGNGRAPFGQEGSNDAYSQQPQQFGAAPNSGAQSFGGARPGSQYQPQLGAAGRQYIAPNAGNNFQNIPQQEFDDQTGYKY